MKYIIKHKQTGKYFNMSSRGMDSFNLGINPKIYTNEVFLKKDLESFHTLKTRQLQIYSNTEYGLDIHGKPSWYEDRHTKKLTEKQKQKLEWFETAHRINKENIVFMQNLQFEDLVVEEYKE
jgi:hypothetical protein